MEDAISNVDNYSRFMADDVYIDSRVIPIQVFSEIVSRARTIDVIRLAKQHISFVENWILNDCHIFSCINKGLQKLPRLPNCREILCGYNRILTLPPLPEARMIVCNDNFIDRIHEKYPYCEYFDCRNNLIRHIEHDGFAVCNTFDCGNNFIRSLPALPSCKSLYCDGNVMRIFPMHTCALIKKKYDNNEENAVTTANFQENIVSKNNYMYYTRAVANKYNLVYPSPSHSYYMASKWVFMIRVAYYMKALQEMESECLPDTCQDIVLSYLYEHRLAL